MKQLVYITGSGHSGSTLLDRLMGSHPDIAALGEIHRFSLGLHRDETPFRCDCGETVQDCSFWSRVLAQLTSETGIPPAEIARTFQTTDHATLKQPSGNRYFNTNAAYRTLPVQPEKYLISIIPKAIVSVLEPVGVFGGQLEYARNSHALFSAAASVSGASTVVDSTKNPIRMRALYLTASHPMKVIYLRRDGRAVTNSRMRRQGISMRKAADIWVTENRKVRLILRTMKRADVLNMTYEALCADPEREMSRIIRFLDLPMAETRLGVDRHAIGGNPSRLDGVHKIKIDEAWREQLSLEDVQTFNQLAGSEQALLNATNDLLSRGA